MVRWMKLILLGFVFAVVGSCATPDPVQRLPQMRFTDKPAINLAVAGVDVQSRYTPPLRAPNVDHRFPVSPEAALRQWAKDRLVPTGGGAAIARFIVLNGAAVEEKLTRTQGVRGALTTDQAERYSAKAEATIEIVDPSGRVLGQTEARVGLSRTIPEGATLNEREKHWYELTRDMMAQFDAEIEGAIRRYLVNWVR